MIKLLRACIAYLLMLAMTTTTFQPIYAQPGVNGFDLPEVSHSSRQLKVEQPFHNESEPAQVELTLAGDHKVKGSIRDDEEDDKFYDALETRELENEEFFDVIEPTPSKITELPSSDPNLEDEDVDHSYPSQTIDENEEGVLTPQPLWRSLFNLTKGTCKVFYECAKFAKKNPGKVILACLLIFSPSTMASSEFRLNENIPSSAPEPSPVFLTPDVAHVSLIGLASGGSATGFTFRTFDTEGTPLSPELSSGVNANQAFQPVPVRTGPNSTLTFYVGAPGSAVSARAYETNGLAIGPIQEVGNRTRQGREPDAVTDLTGQFHTVVFFDQNADEVFAQTTDNQGAIQFPDDVLLSPVGLASREPTIDRGSNGNFGLAYQGNRDGTNRLLMQIRSGGLAPVVPETLISPNDTMARTSPDIDAFEDNTHVVVYERDDDSIQIQSASATLATGPEVQVSDSSNNMNFLNPRVGILPDTTFPSFPQETVFVVWDETIPPTDTNVYGRLMTRTLAPLTPVLMINQNTTNDQFLPRLAVEPSTGNIFVTWASNQDGLIQTYGRFLNRTFFENLIEQFPTLPPTTSSQTSEATNPDEEDDNTPLIAGVVTGVSMGLFYICCCTTLGVSYCLLHRNHEEQTHHPEIRLDESAPTIPIHASEPKTPSVFDPQNTGYTEDRLTFEGNLTGQTYILLDQVGENEVTEFQPNLAKLIEPEGREEKAVFEKQKMKKNPLKAPRFDFHIDKGNFGTLYLGLTGNQKVAIKVVTGHGIKDSLTEGELMNAVNPHPNVMRLLDYKHNKPDIGLETLNQVMELAYCNGIHFAKMLAALSPKDRMDYVGDAFAQTMAGLAHLHKYVEHYDMKLANLLVFLTGRIKIGDFGKAKPKNLAISDPLELGDVTKLAPEATALVRNSAPEQFKGERVKTVSGSKLDIFATGLLAVEAFGDNPEFYSHKVVPVRTRVASWTYGLFNTHIQSGLEVIPTDAPFLPTVKQCLEIEPSKRISSDESANQLSPLLLADNYREVRFSQLMKDFQSQASKAPELPKMSRDQLYQKPSDIVYANRQIKSLYPQRREYTKDQLYHQPTDVVYSNQPTDSDHQFMDEELQLSDTYNNE